MAPIACSLDADNFRDAIVELQADTISISAASQKYNIPTRKRRTSLFDLRHIIDSRIGSKQSQLMKSNDQKGIF